MPNMGNATVCLFEATERVSFGHVPNWYLEFDSGVTIVDEHFAYCCCQQLSALQHAKCSSTTVTPLPDI